MCSAMVMPVAPVGPARGSGSLTHRLEDGCSWRLLRRGSVRQRKRADEDAGGDGEGGDDPLSAPRAWAAVDRWKVLAWVRERGFVVREGRRLVVQRQVGGVFGVVLGFGTLVEAELIFGAGGGKGLVRLGD